MSNLAATHPDPEQVRRFGLGHLVGEQADLIEQHVSCCELCMTRLLELPNDSLVELLRRKRPSAGTTQAIAGIPPLPETVAEQSLAALVQPDDSDATRTIPPDASVSAPARPHLPGYEIEQELGRGGNGVVYKAIDTRLKRCVALKMILAGGHAGAAALARFRTEAEAEARLQHPNIVQVFEVGVHEGLPYFALEFCPGGSLDAKLDGTPLPAKEAAALLEKLAHAMHAAHLKGVIHRDLKPANVLLAEPASGEEALEGTRTRSSLGMPKITDFGLAKMLDEAGQTQTDVIMGTPSYMAPEQAEGKKGIGPACDVYALGAILYECLTGRPPFKAATPLDTMLQVVSDEPVPPRSLQPKTPRDLETICLKCLHKEPGQRYASAKELAEDLRRFQAGAPIRARPVGQLERAWRWSRRNPVVAGLLALVAVTLLGGTAVATFFGLDSKVQARRAEEAAKKEHELLTRLSLSQGQTLCEAGDIGQGMLWQAHTLELIPEQDSALSRAVRTSLAAWSRRLHPLRNTWTHPGVIQVTAFRPDGRVVLTASTDHKVRLWQTATGTQIAEPLTHPDRVLAACFGPDGTILTGCADRVLRLWKAGAPSPVTHSLGAGPIRALAFSADGRFAATSREKAVQLWETATGKLVGATDHPGVIPALAVSADGKAVLTGDADGAVRLWEVSAGKPRDLCGHRWGIRAVAFSPDGRFILTGSEDYTARLWVRVTGKPVGEPLKHQDIVQAVAFAPGGRILLTAGQDGTVRLWQAQPGQSVNPLGSPLEHHGPVWAAAFSPDGRHILAGDQDQRAWLWEVAAASPHRLQLEHQNPVMAVGFHPDGKVMATASNGQARLWEVEGGKQLDCLPAQKEEIWALAFSPDGRRILTDRENTAWLRDVTTPTHRQLKALAHDLRVRSVAFSRDGRTILTGSGDMARGMGMAQLWGAGADEPGPTSLYQGEPVWAVAFGADRTCAVASGNNAIRLWAAADRDPVALAPLHRNRVMALAFSPDGQLLLSASTDRTARLWDAVTGAPVGNALHHPGGVLAAAFTPDGRSLVTGSQDGRVRLWDTATGTLLGPAWRHDGAVWCVACRPTDGAVLTGSDDRTARLWPIPTPLEGSAERLVLWTQVMTARELDDNGIVRPLDVPTWQQCHRRLEELGGPPLP